MSISQKGKVYEICEVSGSISKSLNGNDVRIDLNFSSITNNDCSEEKWANVTLTGCSYSSGGNSTVVEGGTNNEVFDIKVSGTGTQTIYATLHSGYTIDNIMVSVMASTRSGANCSCYYSMS